jgi:microcystin-dependent protein
LSSTGNLQGFPTNSSPVVDPNNQFRWTQPWLQFVIALWKRTGAAQGNGVSPTGIMAAFSAPTPPPGWLICDGSAIDRIVYAALFSVIGTTWGAGDGITTFNLPSCSNRFLIGAGTYAFATRGGYTSVSLTVDQLPSHSHSVTDPGHSHTSSENTGAGNLSSGTGVSIHSGTTGISTTGISIGTTGSGNPVQFLPPYASVVWIIKT